MTQALQDQINELEIKIDILEKTLVSTVERQLVHANFMNMLARQIAWLAMQEDVEIDQPTFKQ